MQGAIGLPLRERFAKYRDDSKLRRESIVKNWPKEKTYITADELVNDGFYSTGQGDKVQCCYCGGILSNWKSGDKVHEEHARLFERCPFIKQPYKYPEYADKSARVNSFKDWPHQLRQKPEDLAEAGFFYHGQGDKTRCFWCGGILCDWEPTDEPLKEHIKWFSECSWLSIIRDREFIEDVLKQHQESSQSHGQKTSDKSSVLDDVRNMGFTKDKIDKAVKKVGGNLSVQSLVEAIFEMDKDTALKKVAPSTPENREFMDIKSLKKENKDLKKRSVCKICMDADVDVVFIPCGHLVCCVTCSGSVTKCPMCRQNIARSVKVYW